MGGEKGVISFDFFAMPKIRNIIATFLVLGLIYAELLPTLIPNSSQAYLSENTEPTHSELLLAFLDPTNKQEVAVVAPADSVIFVNDISEVPSKLIGIAENAQSTVAVGYTTTTIPLPASPDGTNSAPPAAVIYQPVPVEDQAFIGDVIPAYGTPLFDAYATGGRAWYQESDKVVVIFPDSETFRSFQRSTGQSIDWLQDRLSYDPLDSPGALENYLNNYHGEIVAETEDWALVKFPSGGFLKIAKPTTTATTSTQGPFFSQQ